MPWVMKILMRAISNVHMSYIWPMGCSFPTLDLYSLSNKSERKWTFSH